MNVIKLWFNWDIFNGETTNYQLKEAMEGKER